MKEWVDTTVETASYESMLNRLKGKLVPRAIDPLLCFIVLFCV